MGRILEIIRLGNPTLRKQAKKVHELKKRQDSYSAFIDDLYKTQKYYQGVGIAAPQVNLSKQIIIVASYPNQRYPEAPEMSPIVMVNPQITSHSDDMEQGWEGCLSVPGLRGLVSRYKSVNVKYTDMEETIKEQEFTGFPARIVQHEIDHLSGKVYIDRVSTTEHLVHESEYNNRLLQTELAALCN